MILYHFIKHNRKLAVMASHQGLHRSRYIRLMLLACSEMLTTIPISSFEVNSFCRFGLTKFSWTTLRHNHTHVPQYTTIEWQSDTVAYALTVIDAWLPVYFAFIFFAFFGFADDARGHYRRVYLSITRRIRFSKSSGTLVGPSHAYVVQPGFVCWTHVFAACRRAKLPMSQFPWSSQETGGIPSFHSPINLPSPLFPSAAICSATLKSSRIHLWSPPSHLTDRRTNYLNPLMKSTQRYNLKQHLPTRLMAPTLSELVSVLILWFLLRTFVCRLLD
jgi:Pheromone A receptor